MANGRSMLLAQSHWKSRRDDIEEMLKAEDPAELDEYFLSLCYSPAGVDNDRLEGSAEFLISWGGPSEALEVFFDTEAARPYKIYFWYKDWDVGQKLVVTHDKIAIALFERYRDYFHYLRERAKESGETQCLG